MIAVIKQSSGSSMLTCSSPLQILLWYSPFCGFLAAFNSMVVLNGHVGVVWRKQPLICKFHFLERLCTTKLITVYLRWYVVLSARYNRCESFQASNRIRTCQLPDTHKSHCLRSWGILNTNRTGIEDDPYFTYWMTREKWQYLSGQRKAEWVSSSSLLEHWKVQGRFYRVKFLERRGLQDLSKFGSLGYLYLVILTSAQAAEEKLEPCLDENNVFTGWGMFFALNHVFSWRSELGLWVYCWL